MYTNWYIGSSNSYSNLTLSHADELEYNLSFYIEKICTSFNTNVPYNMLVQYLLVAEELISIPERSFLL